MSTSENAIEFTRVNNDVNGNPRYVCHFLNFIAGGENLYDVDTKYNLALSRAKKIGGRKFHNKQYGGGIVFQSYNISATEKEIRSLMEEFK